MGAGAAIAAFIGALPLLLSVELALWAGPSPRGDLQVVTERRCLRGTLGQLYCAMDEQGVALENALGTVVCAPGDCMKVDVALSTAWDSEWLCASVSGGTVSLLPDGPSCEGGCQPPKATSCEVR